MAAFASLSVPPLQVKLLGGVWLPVRVKGAHLQDRFQAYLAMRPESSADPLAKDVAARLRRLAGVECDLESHNQTNSWTILTAFGLTAFGLTAFGHYTSALTSMPTGQILSAHNPALRRNPWKAGVASDAAVLLRPPGR